MPNQINRERKGDKAHDKGSAAIQRDGVALLQGGGRHFRTDRIALQRHVHRIGRSKAEADAVAMKSLRADRKIIADPRVVRGFG